MTRITRDIPRASGPHASHIGKRHIYRDDPVLPLTTFCGKTSDQLLATSTRGRSIFLAPLTLDEVKDKKLRLDGPWCKRCRKGAGLEARP